MLALLITLAVAAVVIVGCAAGITICSVFATLVAGLVFLFFAMISAELVSTGLAVAAGIIFLAWVPVLIRREKEGRMFYQYPPRSRRY